MALLKLEFLIYILKKVRNEFSSMVISSSELHLGVAAKANLVATKILSKQIIILTRIQRNIKFFIRNNFFKVCFFSLELYQLLLCSPQLSNR